MSEDDKREVRSCCRDVEGCCERMRMHAEVVEKWDVTSTVIGSSAGKRIGVQGGSERKSCPGTRLGDSTGRQQTEDALRGGFLKMCAVRRAAKCL